MHNGGPSPEMAPFNEPSLGCHNHTVIALSHGHSTVVVTKSLAELMQKKGDLGAGSGLCQLTNRSRLGVSGGEA